MNTVKHTLKVKIFDRIDWIDKRCGLTEIQKDYVSAQMKEAVVEALRQDNEVDKQAEKALAIQGVSICSRCKIQPTHEGSFYCIDCLYERKMSGY